MEKEIRTRALIGAEGLKKLHKAHIILLGLGGVGGHCMEALARAGIGKLTLIDGDVISESNLNRQLLALRSTLGMPKTQAALERLREIDPALQVTALQERLTPENIGELLPADGDYLIDCIDDVPAKLALADYCREHQLPMVMCLGTGNRLTAAGQKIVNFDRTEGCPLAKKMRITLKKQGFRKLRVLFSADAIHPLFPVEDGGKTTVGSISFVPSAAGLKLAEHAVNRLLTGEENQDIPR